MEKGFIHINGFIGNIVDNDGKEVKGIELVDIIKQVQGQPMAECFDVYIKSPGGVVDVGFDIYSYLRSLNKPIKTIGNELVASIATVIFMAGDERILSDKTQFMIHLPMGSVSGTADEIESYSELVRGAEKKILDFYKKITNLTEEALLPLLKQETYLTPSDAFDLKFATSYEIDYPAVAYLNLKPSNMFTLTKKEFDENVKKTEGMFEKIFNILSVKGKIKALILQEANGADVDFTDLADGDTPKVGDKATLDGKPIPDGDYVFPSLENITIAFLNGEVSEVATSEEEGKETEALKQENESLKAEIETLKTQNSTHVNDLKEATTAIKSLKTEFDGLKKSVGSTFNYKADDNKNQGGGASGGKNENGVTRTPIKKK